jgi:hypothetical protein
MESAVNQVFCNYLAWKYSVKNQLLIGCVAASKRITSSPEPVNAGFASIAS